MRTASGVGFHLADYLEQYGKRHRSGYCPPDGFWLAALREKVAGRDIAAIAGAAYARDWAHIAHRLALEVAIRGDAAGLATVARLVNDHGGPAETLPDLELAAENGRKLLRDGPLRDFVVEGLRKRWSPQQICNALVREYPDDQELRVSPETIYQALYVQARGALKREVAAALRTGRTRRKPRRRPDQRTPRFVDSMLMISERPAEVEDRAVPGHWEGDLIMGTGNQSAIVTLVERATRYVMLGHLPGGHTAEEVRDVLVDLIATLPAHLRGSLTWDQGAEWLHTSSSRLPPECPSTSATRTHPGSADRTRTPTACYASTSPKAPTCPCTGPRTSNTSLNNSTDAHAKHSAGTTQPSVCVIY